MEYRTLNHKAVPLDKTQLEQYLEKLASDHILQSSISKDTYPIPKVKENFEMIEKVYHLLNEHIKIGIPIHPAGEWLLDNFYIIEEVVKTIKQDMSLKKYRQFIGISNGADKGFARIYVLAHDIVNYTDNHIDSKNLSSLLAAYQRKKTLSMQEIWNIGTFMQIALIQNIRDISEKIYFSQMQKYRAENIIERLVEKKQNLKYKNITEYRTKVKGYGEMKYPFIEYLSYKLRKQGKNAKPFIDVLEEQVNKMGTTIDEVIKKEHFDVALKKVSMANCITSMKKLQRMDYLTIFEQSNGIEEILKEDPINIYSKMDLNTKDLYRNAIQEIAKKTKIAEIYISKKALKLAQEQYTNLNENKNVNQYKQSHIGYYLISDGKEKLYEELQQKQVKKINRDSKAKIYIFSIWSISLVLDIIYMVLIKKQTNNTIITILFGLFLIIPIQQIVVQIIQYILGKIVKPKVLPKMDFSQGVPQEASTFVVIPTILKSKDKVKELMKKLEIYYLANKSKNIYFALLGDCSSGQNKEEPFDKEVIEEGIKQSKKLNEKYKENIFHFIYRKRNWNGQEECFMGWERKRGLLNQFNEYLLGNIENPFLVNTLEQLPKSNRGYKRDRGYIGDVSKWELLDKTSQKGQMPHLDQMPHLETSPMGTKMGIKYIITLDADTELVLNSAIELVGTMEHVLNKPVLNDNKDLVIDGHALIQPRIGISIEAANKNLFTKIFAGSGGIDAYTNAISDVYQDNFDEGIFTGKGIYDLQVFSKILSSEIPENTVLSHDLLEGSYLRCALATDIILMDGYPSNYSSFKQRLYRWTRGDFQIVRWTKNTIIDKRENEKVNPLNILSRYKLMDNLFRAIVPISNLIIIILVYIISFITKSYLIDILALVIFNILFPIILDIINRIIYKKEGQSYQKTFAPRINSFLASIIRGIISLMVLPDKAYSMLSAIVKTIYRVNFSKKHLLEWTTSEEAEKLSKTNMMSYYLGMIPNIVLGIIGIFYSSFFKNSILNFVLVPISFLWLVAPFVLWRICKIGTEKEKINEITKSEKDYLYDVGKRTWQYFKDTLIDKYNFLPPDNYQEGRKPILVNRTSSTNIGLALICVISSYDMGYESLEDTLNLLDKMIKTIEKLPKWNDHLYNWYNIETLEPLTPRYISSVDSGNFVGYVYVLKSFYEQIKNQIKDEIEIINNEEELENKRKLLNLIPEWADKPIENVKIANADFSKLYDNEKNLFSIGFNIEENKLTESYYDLLASEARQASFIAISKKDVPVKHWRYLSRTLTEMNGYNGLVSWSGTAFEYLMPNLIMKNEEGSLIDESCEFMLMEQKEYAKKLNLPWGFSETAFYLKDLNGNFQYKAIGIPWLGLKRGLEEDMVVTSYASGMALTRKPKEALKNLKILEKQKMLDKYGFYESIDYTPLRMPKGKKQMIIKTYMAHHEALILGSINNLFNNNILQERFSANPEIAASLILLQETMPENRIITKEEKIKLDKIVYKDYENFAQRAYKKTDTNLPICNVIANENYSILMDVNGNGYSKYKNYLINKYDLASSRKQGINFYLKNIKNKKVWTLNKERSETIFSEDSNRIKSDNNLTVSNYKVTVSPEKPLEIRRLELINNSKEEQTLEITTAIEPALTSIEALTSHPAFLNLFLIFEYLEDDEIFVIRRKDRESKNNDIYMAISFSGDEKSIIGELEYETDNEKFQGRGNLGLPIMVQNSKPFSKKIQYVLEPVLALRRTILLKPDQKNYLNLLISVSENREEAIKNIKEYNKEEKIEKTFELALAKADTEARYLGLKADKIKTYQKMLGYILFSNPLEKKDRFKGFYEKENLWQYGISGDLPIILVKIKNSNEVEVLEEAIEAYEFFRLKNIEVDLVILNKESNSYEKYTKEAVQNTILNSNLAYMQNQKGGIFIIENENEELLEFYAKLIIDTKKGPIERQLQDLEEDYNEKKKQIADKTHSIPRNYKVEKNAKEQLSDKNLLYENEYGGFLDNGKEYLISQNIEERIPTVWSNVMANETFGTVVTDSMGGFTFSKNSGLNKITNWSNNQVTDEPSEVIYMQDDETFSAWSLGLNPMADNKEYSTIFGYGYAKYIHESDDVKQELIEFVADKDSAKFYLLNLKNYAPKKKKFNIIFYIKPVLGENLLKTIDFVNLKFEENNNMLIIQNKTNTEFKELIYVTSTEKIKFYTGDKKFFFGDNNLSEPDSLKKIALNNENSIGKDQIAAIQIEIDLEAYESKDISFILGSAKTLIDCQDKAYQYSKIDRIEEELSNVRNKWKNILEKVQVYTPLDSFNILMNGWLIYQTIACRLYAKSGFYQSGGAFGFRDQLQDTIALKYFDTNYMKEQIIKHSKHQFKEGDVEHWWHDETKRGIRTRFSDDLLWLVYLTEEYINYTGDYSILEEETPYIKGKQLENYQNDQYDIHDESDIKESIFKHCERAINKSLEFGQNGLPLIGSGDWNDGFSNVGINGKGESVWLGFFLYDILKKWLEIKEDFEKYNIENSKIMEESIVSTEIIKEKIKILKKSLNENGWDGRWYRRAFTDDGKILGTLQNEECKIDGISQSWSIISNAGDNDKKYVAMESLENHLVDRENGIIKLLDPPFEKSDLEPGYIKAYLPGIRENGGQYTHECCSCGQFLANMLEIKPK